MTDTDTMPDTRHLMSEAQSRYNMAILRLRAAEATVDAMRPYGDIEQADTIQRKGDKAGAEAAAAIIARDNGKRLAAKEAETSRHYAESDVRRELGRDLTDHERFAGFKPGWECRWWLRGLENCPTCGGQRPVYAGGVAMVADVPVTLPKPPEPATPDVAAPVRLDPLEDLRRSYKATAEAVKATTDEDERAVLLDTLRWLKSEAERLGAEEAR